MTKRIIRFVLSKIGIWDFLRTVRDVILLSYGLLVFKLTGMTPKAAFNGMRGLFCRTSGRSNDYLHGLIAKSRPPVPIQNAGILGKLQSEELAKIKDQLNTRGYYIFENRLPESLCDNALQWALTEKADLRIDGKNQSLVYDRTNPAAVHYSWNECTILKCPEAQMLMADPGILAVAQEYLACKPHLDLIAFWWITTFSKLPDSDAAQLFHFDMDRIKWLKFFFYITDVGPNNGPHIFVAGSHRPGGIPRGILDKGAVRIDDSEIMAHYAKEDIIEICGRRGTIIAVDTRGLHKGKPVQVGDRLVFQLEFCSSLFGWEYPNPKGVVIGNELSMMSQAYPGVYDRYV
jgi:hypothetical protein